MEIWVDVKFGRIEVDKLALNTQTETHLCIS